MAKVIQLQSTGGPEVMQWVEVELGQPGPGEALVRHGACGLNYIDVYFRNGTYPSPLPMGLGMEGAGVVVAVGAGVEHVRPGDRVAYAGNPIGAYASERVMPAKVLVKVPDAINDETAAAMMLKGMTVQYLLRRTFRVQPGQTILFHAAAGGVGLIAMQWAKALGAKVIGTVGSDDKAALAAEHGCDYPVVYTRENFVERVMEITEGRGVPVVYDSIGQSTFDQSLSCLSPFGTMVSFGNASGPVPPVPLSALKGTLFLTRPSLMPYTADRGDLEATAGELMSMVASGQVKIRIDQRYALSDVAQAHRDLESRKTTGCTVLLPGA